MPLKNSIIEIIELTREAAAPQNKLLGSAMVLRRQIDLDSRMRLAYGRAVSNQIVRGLGWLWAADMSNRNQNEI